MLKLVWGVLLTVMVRLAAFCLLLAGCGPVVRTEHPQSRGPAWLTHPECAQEYDKDGRTVAVYCPAI